MRIENVDLVVDQDRIFANMPNVVWIDMKNLDLTEGVLVQSFDLASDISASGEVSGKLRPPKPLAFYEEDGTMSWKPAPVVH